ncbi:lysine N(6)-hydroxylase/L-ornithine N(5)-oxygenase family protein [Corynebacterium bovis]|uniref:lysine N(6)-hydroxylase/L-ornithine N(5)-oxygenase family protein n=1 Tax=Corynebacterium bovis TaxID=36808 RepID=UPI000F6486DE|nr:SidA/IucD/PvdA family monooxygenase [Corynebacterium bovis]RRO79995.1 ornithine monooxygenase [Corynebacterium bovis]RRO80601.1 ornithine monooxygenase [Corynebacterium bovis]RRO81554.1 ornithine monooxygenase [Corynebacterium bovis]RRO89445.1 ornithine monooxygenase [Corynebacterium bovis]
MTDVARSSTLPATEAPTTTGSASATSATAPASTGSASATSATTTQPTGTTDPAATGDAGRVRDVVGVGFGPGNLGLAVALEEENPGLDALFLESRDHFAWHPGMLLPGANMQISFLKDLATVRNPRSRYTFTNYLRERGRLVDFINRQTFTPERVEFTDYLAWVAETVEADVRYGAQVVAVEEIDAADGAGDRAGDPATGGPDAAGDGARADGARFLVRAEVDGRTVEIPTRSVVVARGLRPRMPAWATDPEIAATGRVVHNIDIVPRLDQLDGTVGRATGRGWDGTGVRALVVGGGQSAAEVVRHLHDGGATVTCTFNGFGFVPADDSPYANRVFDPSAVDDFFTAPDDVRGELMIRHRYTNYACVESELVTELYEREYREQITGDRRLDLRRTTVVDGVRALPDGRVEVGLRDRITGERTADAYDIVVCATGFVSRGLTGLTGAGAFGGSGVSGVSGEVDDDRSAVRGVTRDYHVVGGDGPVPGLFVQGATEATHGLGSTLLSNIATRSGELVEALRADLDVAGSAGDPRVGAGAEAGAGADRFAGAATE